MKAFGGRGMRAFLLSPVTRKEENSGLPAMAGETFREVDEVSEVSLFVLHARGMVEIWGKSIKASGGFI
jgi:hypothetical protein